MANINTEDTTPTELAILPDWSQGVEVELEYPTAIQRSWSGRDQRQRKRVKPIRTQRYTRTGLTAAQARARLGAIRDEIRVPQYAPWWADGIQITTMANQTTVTLDIAPIEGDWADIVRVFLWSRSLGGEFRTLSSQASRTLTLSGTGTLYSSGWCFPCPIQLRQLDEQQLTPVDLREGIERITMRRL